MNPAEYPNAAQYTAAPVPPSDDVVRRAKKAYSRSALNIALYGLIGIVLVYAVIIVLYVAGVYDKLSVGMLYLVQFVPQYCVAFPLYLLLSKPLAKDTPAPQKMNIGQLILAFFCAEAIMIGGNLIGTIFNVILTSIIGVETASSFLQEGVFGEGSTLFLMIAVLCAPIIEEMIFRKVLIDRIRRYSDKTAIIMSGVLFGLFHGNFSQFFYAAGLGLFLAWIYVRTGKVRYTITLHMMINFLGSCVPLLVMRNLDMDRFITAVEENNVGEIVAMMGQLIPYLIYAFVIYGLALTGLIILIVNRKRFTIEQPIEPLPKGKGFKTAVLNLGVILMVLFCLVEFVVQIAQNYVKTYSAEEIANQLADQPELLESGTEYYVQGELTAVDLDGETPSLTLQTNVTVESRQEIVLVFVLSEDDADQAEKLAEKELPVEVTVSGEFDSFDGTTARFTEATVKQ